MSTVQSISTKKRLCETMSVKCQVSVIQCQVSDIMELSECGHRANNYLTLTHKAYNQVSPRDKIMLTKFSSSLEKAISLGLQVSGVTCLQV